MVFKRVVNVIEVVTLVVVVVFVVELFTNEPGGRAGSSERGPGYVVYLDHCARCHGQDGEGRIGPQLAGGAVVAAFPEEADEIRLVEDGRGIMPAFKDDLSDEEIRDVVEYTRTGFR